MSNYLSANRANWDERADVHIEDSSGAYSITAFLAGEDVLFPIEAPEIGDVSGLDVLHLQCHIGIDTLCLARRGARVTGLDFSENALRHAAGLARRAGLEARFVLGDVYQAPERVGGAFDLVYTTWGTICWLPDIRRWGETVAQMLRPGGRLYFADTHPMIQPLEEIDGRLLPTFGYRTPTGVPLAFTASQTYTGDTRQFLNAENFEWVHPLSDILMALIDGGLAISHVAEHEGLPWQMFPMMVKGEDRLWRLPAGHPRLPLSLSLTATKPS
jgi:SAM-dependent methyltransferase